MRLSVVLRLQVSRLQPAAFLSAGLTCRRAYQVGESPIRTGPERGLPVALSPVHKGSKSSELPSETHWYDWVCSLLSLKPGVLGPALLGLLPDPFGHSIGAVFSKHFAIAAHLAAPFGGNHRDLQWALDAIALERFELERFAPANDVAAIEVTAHAMGFKQGSAIRCRMGWGWSHPESQHQQQAN